MLRGGEDVERDMDEAQWIYVDLKVMYDIVKRRRIFVENSGKKHSRGESERTVCLVYEQMLEEGECLRNNLEVSRSLFDFVEDSIK